MERLNKITLADQLKRPEKPVAVYLSVRKGGFGMSAGLYGLMGNPTHVEFVLKDKLLYIVSASEEVGFLITVNLKAKNYSFSCKPVSERFFKGEKQRAVVFTMPVELQKIPVAIGFEVKLPKL